MARELLLLRHGKSDWAVDVDDFHRPLKDRGKRGAQRIGVWLAQQDLMPDLIVSSPAERALVTAEKCAKVLGIGGHEVQRDERVYLASRKELLRALADCPPEAGRVMLVGHNPGLEDLLCYLAEEPPPRSRDGKLMATSTLARLAMPDDWSAFSSGAARLLDIQRSSTLPRKFPFPSPHGEELRDRPAYYYTQSGVIPFRQGDEGLQVLIVRSSGNKHWVVPKGIADPGRSLQDSARKEAREEAGVEGEVLDPLLGEYRYEKWGGECTVTMYPLRVVHELSEKEWRERHRGRRWVSIEEAAELLKQQALAPMLSALRERLQD